MAELQFDAVLIDQISPTLKTIADSFIALQDASKQLADTMTVDFDDMRGVVQSFETAVTAVQSGVELAFTAMAVSVGDLQKAFVDVAPVMQAFDNSLVTFSNTTVTDFVSSENAATDAVLKLSQASNDAVNAFKTETDAVLPLTDAFNALADKKAMTSELETELGAASTGTAGAMGREALAADTAGAAVSREGKAGIGTMGHRATGYGAIIGATMLLGMAGAAARLGVDMIKSGMDSEASLYRVLALADRSRSDFEQYKTTIIGWSVELGASIKDLANGLYDIKSVGYSVADSLKILHAAAEAAAAGQVDLHTVTNGLTSILKVYGATADQATQYTDYLITGVREGKAPFDQFSRAIGLVGVASRQANFNISESAAALATLTAVWPSVRQAGQNLQNMIQTVGINFDALAKHAKKAGIAFDEQKYSTMDLQQKLQYLWQQSGENTQKFRELIGNATATKAAFYLASAGAVDFNNNLIQMKNSSGATADAFEIHKETMLFAMQQLHAAVGVLSMKFATLVEPAVLVALRALSSLFADVAMAIETHAKIMTPIVIGLAMAIGGLLIGAIVALDEVLAGPLLAALGVAAPFMLVAAAVGLVVGWFVQAYQSSKPLRDAVAQLGAALGSLWAILRPALAEIVKPFVDGLRDVAVWMGLVDANTKKTGKSSNDATGLIGLLVGVIKGLTQAIKNLVGWFNPLVTNMGHVSKAVDDGRLHFRQFIDEITKGKGPITDHALQAQHMGDIHQRLMGFLKGLAGVLAVVGLAFAGVAPQFLLSNGALDAVAVGFGKFTRALHGIPEFVGRVAKAFGDLVVKGLDLLTQGFLGQLHPIDALKGAFSTIKGIITTLMNDGFDSLVIKVFNLMGSFEELLPAIMSVASTVASFTGIALVVAAVVAGLVVAFKKWWDTSAGFRAMIGEVGKQLLSLWTMLQSQFKPIWDQIVSLFQNDLMPTIRSLKSTWDAIQPALVAIGTIVIAVLLVALGLLIGIIKGLISALAPLIGGILTALVGAFKVVVGIIQLVVGVVGGLISLFVDLIFNQKNLGNDLKNIWENIKNAAGNIFGGLWMMVQGIFGGAIKAILNFIGGFIGGIIDFFTHLFEKLVGHSIVPDMIMGVINWFLKLPIQILDMIGRFVINLLAHFLMLEIRAIATIRMMIALGVALFDSLRARVISIVLQFVANIINNFIQLQNKIHKTISDALTAVTNLFTKFASNAINLGLNIMKQIGAGIANGIKFLTGPIQNGLQKIRDLFPHSPAKEGPLRDAPNWTPTLMGQLKDGIEQHGPSVVGSAKKLAGQLAGNLNKLQAGLGGPGSGSIGGSLAGQVSGGGGGSGEQHFHVHLDGPIGAGLSMINATDRARIAQDIARELGKQMRMQGRTGTGYSGS